MPTTSALPRRAIAFVAALVLTLMVAFAAISNSWTATAGPEAPSNVEVVADDDMTIAGPSWTYSRIVYPTYRF